jgi:hypothetical protein
MLKIALARSKLEAGIMETFSNFLHEIIIEIFLRLAVIHEINIEKTFEHEMVEQNDTLGFYIQKPNDPPML